MTPNTTPRTLVERAPVTHCIAQRTRAYDPSAMRRIVQSRDIVKMLDRIG